MKTITKNVFIISLIIFIITPLFFFFYLVPNQTIEGQRNIYSQISHYSTKQEKDLVYNVMVTYDIFVEDNQTYLMPLSINWSNGGSCHQDEGDYGKSGEVVTLIAQDDEKYKITLPTVEYDYVEQLKNVNIALTILCVLVFVYTGYNVFTYLVNKKAKEIAKQ